MTDPAFLWGLAIGALVVGALWNWRAGVQRRKLRAAEWKAEGLRRCAVELHSMIKGCAPRSAMEFLRGMIGVKPWNQP